MALALLLWALIEPLCLTLRHSYFSQKNGSPRGSVYPGKAGETICLNRPAGSLRLALISDLHSSFCQISPDRLSRLIAQASVDGVVFAGDISTWHWDRLKGLSWLKKLSGLLKDKGLILYAVPGNHDQGLTAAKLAAYGPVPLYNRSAVLRDRSDRNWLLVGLEDLITGQPDLQQALLHIDGQKSIAAATIPAARTIVLAHNPDTVYRLTGTEAHWILSGHFHGGQIRLPGRLEFKTLRSEGLPQEGIYQHHYHKNGLAGYITNGLGCVLLPFRFLAPPELAILDFLIES